MGKLIAAKGFKNCPKCKKSPDLVTLISGKISNEQAVVMVKWSVMELVSTRI